MARSVLSHVSFGVTDIAKARAFYDPVLKTLGMDAVYEVDIGQGVIAIGYGDGLPEFWIQYPHNRKPASCGNGVHVCLTAQSQKAVDKFHAAALKHGGSDDGKPGLRLDYAPDYYAAFVRDPDGNKLEAVYMASMAGA